MTMELNATFLVQMVHFLVAYIIVDRIVLRLATALVSAEDRKAENLELDGSELQKRITSRIRYNEDDWLILQKRLQSECPTTSLGKHYTVESEIPFISPEVSPEVVQDVAHTCKELLIKRINRIRGKYGTSD
jgi:hypothetical protein